jgi:hypothetical protein
MLNIYNDCKHNNSLTAVKNYLHELRACECTQLPLSFIWLGDFNCHHPLWDEECNNHLFTTVALALTQPLLSMLSQHNMMMALLKDTPMLQASSTGNHTRVDNIFCSANLIQAVVSCDTNPSRCPLKTDHYPIITTIDISVQTSEEEKCLNFRMADWPKFIEAFDERAMVISTMEITMIEDFQERLVALDKAVADTIAEHVLMAKQSPFMKHWWTVDLAAAKKATHKLSQKSYHA